jgi:hypothetical protein
MSEEDQRFYKGVVLAEANAMNYNSDNRSIWMKGQGMIESVEVYTHGESVKVPVRKEMRGANAPFVTFDDFEHMTPDQKRDYEASHQTSEPEADEEMLKTLDEGFAKLGPEIVTSKLTEQAILKESTENGGPNTTLDALNMLMTNCNVGYRRLSKETGVRRKVLVDMLAGKVQMTPEVFGKIHDLAKANRPDLPWMS